MKIPEMIEIPSGSFLIGSPENEIGRYDSEGPQIHVTVPAFSIGKYTVTCEEYGKFCKETNRNIPPTFRGRERFPAIYVSHHDATDYCAWLSEKTGNHCRLPSEAEWEYACRAGTTTPYFFGEDPEKLGEYAWFLENSKNHPNPVGLKKPNPWGLYDMLGNVFEWCLDTWNPDLKGYKEALAKGKARLYGMEPYFRVIRGGDWYSVARVVRSATRSLEHRNDATSYIGFRIVRENRR